MSERSLLPGNATPLEISLSTAANARMGAVDVNAVRRERQPDTCDAAFVALLAFERSIHHWLVGDDAGNRAKVAASFADHASYGSPAALEGEIAADTGQTVRLLEFFDYGSAWPGFKVETIVDSGDVTPALGLVVASALRRKNVRDLFEGVRVFARQPPAPIGVAAGTHVSTQLTIYPQGGALHEPGERFGAATRVLVWNTILPLRAS